MIDCTATITAYDTVHVCNRTSRHDGNHLCLCGITWTRVGEPVIVAIRDGRDSE